MRGIKMKACIAEMLLIYFFKQSVTSSPNDKLSEIEAQNDWMLLTRKIIDYEMSQCSILIIYDARKNNVIQDSKKVNKDVKNHLQNSKYGKIIQNNKNVNKDVKNDLQNSKDGKNIIENSKNGVIENVKNNVFQHGKNEINSFFRIINELRVSVVLFDMGQTETENVENFKERLLSEDPSKCVNIVVLYLSSMSEKILTASTKFWHGYAETLFVNLNGDFSLFKTEFFMNKNFRFTEKLSFIERSTRKYYWNVYNLVLYQGENRQTIIQICSWSNKHGFSKQNPSIFPTSELSTFSGYEFTVAALPYSPFVIENNVSKSGPGRYSGMEISVLEELASILDFRYKYVAPKDRQWGKELKNKEWTGMIGMVGREEADWAVSDITISLHRLQLVDFSVTIFYDASELITPRASPLPLWLGPIQPFSQEGWAAIIFFIGFSSIFITVLSRTAIKEVKNCFFRKFANSFIFCLHIIMLRGGTFYAYSLPLRLYLVTFMLCAMVFSSYYSSSLTSFLVQPGYTQPIKNFEQLSKSDISWSKVDFGGVQQYYFNTTTDPVLKNIGKRVQWRKSLDEILDEVVQGNMATWENAITTRLKVTLHHTDATGQPMVYFTNTALYNERIAWPLIKYAPYKRRFDLAIENLIESGMMIFFYKRVIQEQTTLAALRKKDKDSDEKSSAMISQRGTIVILTIEHFQGPFYLLFIGAGTATLAFCVEISFGNFFKRNRKKIFACK